MSSLTQVLVGVLAALGVAAAELGPILAVAGNLKYVLHQVMTCSVACAPGTACTGASFTALTTMLTVSLPLCAPPLPLLPRSLVTIC